MGLPPGAGKGRSRAPVSGIAQSAPLDPIQVSGADLAETRSPIPPRSRFAVFHVALSKTGVARNPRISDPVAISGRRVVVKRYALLVVLGYSRAAVVPVLCAADDGGSDAEVSAIH